MRRTAVLPRPARGPAAPALALVTALVLAGCTGSDDDGAAGGSGDSDEPVVAEVVATAPDAARTLVPDSDPVAAAVSTSRALYGSSDVAVVAGSGDADAELLGAVAAVGLGVPLLLGSDDPADVLGEELDRLGVQTVLTVGGDADDLLPGGADDVDVVTVPAEAEALEQATGLDLAEATTVPDAERAAAVAGLSPDALPALTAEVPPAPASPSESEASEPSETEASEPSETEATESAASESEPVEATGELPEVQRAEPLEDVVVLASGGAQSLAGIATARAAGAEVLLTGGVTDPRGSAAVVERLATEPTVVVLGADLAGAPGIDWKLDTAATGTQLPGGGQLLFPGRLMVALYGTPGTGALGLLGEQDLPGAIQRAQEYAAQYDPLVETPVVPAFEIIATVASAEAGPDGNYSTEIDPETFRPWIEAAAEAGVYVVLDLQPGRTDFLTQAKQYQSLLEYPHVGLALDPEWRLEPGEVHLRQIGQVGVDEVNQVVTWLADLTRENDLPQKLLILHQFQVRMIIDRERLDTSRDELAIMVHVDGQGSQPAKQDTWAVLHRDAPAPLYWGWKNFIDEDVPMISPEETIRTVQPTPELITYQ
ncbi:MULTISPECIES: cell wall-binding repeat-containing protein [unclassified Modestobacter]|uniref:cell wall-binding repeat-containing protein n=1 Tax=unclassified Modestobacter TaxID=2643866 RepID=UPI0022AB49FF|nr:MULTISPECIES: cell wall-binding repeat-containing protein [unclassified Modestobacter]MCZ2824508.1 cell wall-binding repeat-containing protein [Modestobacter sp. VKM Ac-2981]MCZ2853964.1 cell wall-binding repeat-containing protein [Modestobacter sp. VKM Ac-2982]